MGLVLADFDDTPPISTSYLSDRYTRCILRVIIDIRGGQRVPAENLQTVGSTRIGRIYGNPILIIGFWIFGLVP